MDRCKAFASGDDNDFFTDMQMEKYGELSINIVSLCAENLLSHPFIVVRRQCQVMALMKYLRGYPQNIFVTVFLFVVGQYY